MKRKLLWDQIAGQTETIDYLRTTISRDSLSHAYLFLGPRGVGKRTTAKVLAAAVNCSQGGCGECSSCLKVLHETHPDVLFVEPEGNFVTIGQIRKLQHEANLKRFEGRYKVCIIDEAESMTLAAANAMLKILEEPPDDLVFILVATDVETMPSTTVSRCQLVKFKPIPAREMAGILINQHRLSLDQAELVTKISSGVFGHALEFARLPGRLKRRQRILKVVEGLEEVDEFKLSQVAEQFIEEARKPLESLRKCQKDELAEFEELAVSEVHAAYVRRHLAQKHKRQLSREERQGFDEILDILASWYRDLLCLAEGGCQELLVNMDHLEQLKSQAQTISSGQAEGAVEAIRRTKELLRRNVNMHLAFEVLLFELQEFILKVHPEGAKGRGVA